MGREKSLPGMRVRRLGLMVVVLAGSAMGGTAWAQTVDRNGGWLRAIAGVNDRPIREPQEYVRRLSGNRWFESVGRSL